VLLGEGSLRRAVGEYVTHFLEERNHQGKGNVLLFPRNEEIIGSRKGRVRCKERLGGLLKYYHREAALSFFDHHGVDPDRITIVTNPAGADRSPGRMIHQRPRDARRRLVEDKSLRPSRGAANRSRGKQLRLPPESPREPVHCCDHWSSPSAAWPRRAHLAPRSRLSSASLIGKGIHKRRPGGVGLTLQKPEGACWSRGLSPPRTSKMMSPAS
jgi:hypothetical protein